MSSYLRRLRIDITAGNHFLGTEFQSGYVPVLMGVMIVREVDIAFLSPVGVPVLKAWEIRKINDAGDIFVLRQSLLAGTTTPGENLDTRIVFFGDNDASLYLWPNERIEVVSSSAVAINIPMRADIIIEEPRK
jgi:hypothetical protein